MCDKGFNDKRNLTEHIFTYSGHRQYICEVCNRTFNHNSPMTSLVLTDSSQLRADGFEKLPDQIMYPYAKLYDL
uniref:C2H2-type domain-containing protein n=1 Tax=Timema monikensis TaxID=170555 RepID=A0A7R9EEC9_9NEOP|nr:unnamed protein product [Timema monikensis]